MTAFQALPGLQLFAEMPSTLAAKGLLAEMKGGPLVLLYRRLFAKYGVTPRGVVHLGAHIGQELLPYLLLGYEKVVFVEPDPRLFAVLRQNAAFVEGMSHFADAFVGGEPRPWVQLFQVAAGDRTGAVSLYVQPGNTQENSILKPIAGSHAGLAEAKEVLEVPLQTLDSLMDELQHGWLPADFNVLYVNVEGAELLALRGARDTLRHVELVFCEVNLKSHYEGNPTVEDLQSFMTEQRFTLVWRCGGFLPDTGYVVFVRSAPQT